MFKKGDKGYWLGKKRSPEDIEKFRISHLGHPPPKTAFKKGSTPWNKGKGMWKGSRSEYTKLHYWVKINKGEKKECKKCGSKNNLVWANKSQKYLRIKSDWISLCQSCHIKMDFKFIKEKYETS